MTAHEDFADSNFAPLNAAQWPAPVKCTGSMHTPMLDPAAAKAIADRIDQETLAHMTGAPMPGWAVPIMADPLRPAEVPVVVGIDPGAPEGDRTVLSNVYRGEVGSFVDGITIHEFPSPKRVPVPMLSKQVDTILANHGRPRPPAMPKTLDIIIRPSYPWFHSCGYALGHARAAKPLLRPMRIVALAVKCLINAPTLTHQA